MSLRPSTVLLFACLGCSTSVALTETVASAPVIEAVLVAGAQRTVFRLAWTNTTTLEAALWQSDVSLQLEGPTATVALSQLRDSVGRWVANLTIVEGGTYRLTGSIGGQRIRAETIVPASFTISAPLDSVHLSLGQVGQFAYRWRATGASLFLIDQGYFARGQRATHDTAGQIFVSPPIDRLNQRIRILALNQDAERYLLDLLSPRGNVEGAFGMLGAAIQSDLALSWR